MIKVLEIMIMIRNIWNYDNYIDDDNNENYYHSIDVSNYDK